MTRYVALFFLTSCMSQYAWVSCPESVGWTQQRRDALEWDLIQPDFKKLHPLIYSAMNEYQDVKPDHCLIYSGLREAK